MKKLCVSARERDREGQRESAREKLRSAYCRSALLPSVGHTVELYTCR